jgi:hypothetical protein
MLIALADMNSQKRLGVLPLENNKTKNVFNLFLFFFGMKSKALDLNLLNKFEKPMPKSFHYPFIRHFDCINWPRRAADQMR